MEKSSFLSTNYRTTRTSSSGFTLVELLVVLAVSIIAIFSTLAIVVDIFRSQATGERREEQQNAMVAITNDLTQEIQWSKSAVHTDNGDTDIFTIVRDDPSGDEVTSIYRVHNGILEKNESPLLANTMKVTHFDIQNISSGAVPLWRVQISIEMTNGTPQTLEKILTVSMRRRTE